MAAITKRRSEGLLAIAKPDPASLADHELFRTQTSAGMLAITHRLVTAESARAPEVHAGFQVQFHRLGGVDFGLHQLLEWRLNSMAFTRTRLPCPS